MLRRVRVDGRPGRVTVFEDRIEVADARGTRAMPLRDLAGVGTRAGWSTARLVLTTRGGDRVVVRGLRGGDAATARRVVASLVRGRRP